MKHLEMLQKIISLEPLPRNCQSAVQNILCDLTLNAWQKYFFPSGLGHIICSSQWNVSRSDCVTSRLKPWKSTFKMTLSGMAIIKKSTNNKCWRGCGEKGTLVHCWWECKLIQPLWRTIWRFLEKLKLELPYDPAIPLLGIYPEKTIIQKDTCTPMFTAALFTIARTWKQPKCP